MENDNMIRVAGIVGESITDGPGIRFAIFVQGCPHHCEGCHNPQTHDFSGGDLMSAEEIFEKIKKNPLLRGITLSGGEPACQAKALVPLVKLCREHGLEAAMYSGYTFEELYEKSKTDEDLLELMKLCDTLIDGRFVLSEKSLSIRFRGSKNQRIIDLKQSLEAGNAILNTSERWNG